MTHVTKPTVLCSRDNNSPVESDAVHITDSHHRILTHKEGKMRFLSFFFSYFLRNKKDTAFSLEKEKDLQAKTDNKDERKWRLKGQKTVLFIYLY